LAFAYHLFLASVMIICCYWWYW